MPNRQTLAPPIPADLLAISALHADYSDVKIA
jgi:hypothetical protein